MSNNNCDSERWFVLESGAWNPGNTLLLFLSERQMKEMLNERWCIRAHWDTQWNWAIVNKMCYTCVFLLQYDKSSLISTSHKYLTLLSSIFQSMPLHLKCQICFQHFPSGHRLLFNRLAEMRNLLKINVWFEKDTLHYHAGPLTIQSALSATHNDGVTYKQT